MHDLLFIFHNDHHYYLLSLCSYNIKSQHLYIHYILYVKKIICDSFDCVYISVSIATWPYFSINLNDNPCFWDSWRSVYLRCQRSFESTFVSVNCKPFNEDVIEITTGNIINAAYFARGERDPAAAILSLFPVGSYWHCRSDEEWRTFKANVCYS